MKCIFDNFLLLLELDNVRKEDVLQLIEEDCTVMNSARLRKQK